MLLKTANTCREGRNTSHNDVWGWCISRRRSEVARLLGMHGGVCHYAVDEADLLIAVGVRFDDRVTGKVAEFAQHGFIVHIDIDPSEINKNKLVHIPIVADVKEALSQLNEIVEPPEEGLDEWHAKIAGWKKEDPFAFDETYPGILAQEAIAELSRLTAERNTVVAVGVGQHQMWAAQFYKFRRPRTWLSSSGQDDGLWIAGGNEGKVAVRTISLLISWRR